MLPSSKRSKIRPPRKSLVSSIVAGSEDFDYEKYWSVLASGIAQIQNKNISNLSYEQLYRKAYMIVLRKYGGKLYDNVSELVQTHLLSRREIILLAKDPQQFLQIVLSEWNEHLQSMKFISDVLMYLNRVYVKENKKLLINDLGIQLFKDYVVKYNSMEVGDRLITIILDDIAKVREGQVFTNKHYVMKCIGMMETLEESQGFFSTYFEPRYIDSSVQFFVEFASKYNTSVDVNITGTTYLGEITDFITSEEERTLQMLPEALHFRIMELMNNILIKDRIDDIMQLPTEQQGLSYWLGPALQNSIFQEQLPIHADQLALLYDLIGRIDKDRKILKKRLKELILTQGFQISGLIKNQLESNGMKKSSNTNVAFAISYINTIKKFKQQFDTIPVFSEDMGMHQAIMEAVLDVVNSPPKDSGVNAPEILSIFMDHYIKHLSKSKGGASSNSSNGNNASNKYPDLNIDEFMAESIQFSRLIRDRDAFEAHYSNHFAKRFLNSKGSSATVDRGNKSGASVSIEEFVLAKLSEEMGSTSLEKVMKMNRDIKQSRDLTRDWRKNMQNDNIELDLKICNLANWPKSMSKDYKKFASSEEFPWPSQMRPTLAAFEEWWISECKNDNKLLYWSPKFGSMDMIITYPSKTYEINLSTYAGIIMLLFAPQSTDENGEPVSAFEEKRQLKYEEIKELTKIPEADLKRQLQSIAVAPRSRLLIKVPMTKEVNEGDIFKLNDKFKAPSVKVKVLTVSASSSSSSTSSSSSSSSTTASSTSKRKVVKEVQDEETQEINENIAQGRNIEINAAIVRIMKSRQSLSHNELISELIRVLQNRFLPSTLVIKRQIEDLIEKEYLKRDDENRGLYHYVA